VILVQLAVALHGVVLKPGGNLAELGDSLVFQFLVGMRHDEAS
jgi:hypothetical protein